MIPDLLDLFPQFQADHIGQTVTLSREGRTLNYGPATDPVDFLHEAGPQFLSVWLIYQYADKYPYLYFKMVSYSEVRIYRSNPHGDIYEFLASIIPGVLLDDMVQQTPSVKNRLELLNDESLKCDSIEGWGVCAICGIAEYYENMESNFVNGDLMYICPECKENINDRPAEQSASLD